MPITKLTPAQRLHRTVGRFVSTDELEAASKGAHAASDAAHILSGHKKLAHDAHEFAGKAHRDAIAALRDESPDKAIAHVPHAEYHEAAAQAFHQTNHAKVDHIDAKDDHEDALHLLNKLGRKSKASEASATAHADLIRYHKNAGGAED